MKSICVFCGSSLGTGEQYSSAARILARELASRGIGLVYGGGNIGLMGVLADEMLAYGGRVSGVIPDFLLKKELGHQGITEMHVVQSMHERKIKLAGLADAFIVLPGGFGTLDETFEVLTWNQLGIIRKPIGILNVGGFFDPLVEMIDRMAGQQFVRTEHRSSVIVEEDVTNLIERLGTFTFPIVDGKWIEDLKNSSRY